VGTAAGQTSGNALNWRYTMALPVDGRTWHVDFDDWMYLVDERVMLNRATMSKFGVRLGEVTPLVHPTLNMRPLNTPIRGLDCATCVDRRRLDRHRCQPRPAR
jgi:hypothetical protein